MTAAGSRTRSWIVFLKLWPWFVVTSRVIGYLSWFTKSCLSITGAPSYSRVFPFQKSHFVFCIVPLLTARDAVASNITPIFQRTGFILRESMLLTLTPFIRSTIFHRRGFTEISWDFEKGRTSIFPFLFLLPDTTSRNTW